MKQLQKKMSPSLIKVKVMDTAVTVIIAATVNIAIAVTVNIAVTRKPKDAGTNQHWNRRLSQYKNPPQGGFLLSSWKAALLKTGLSCHAKALTGK